MTAVLLRAKDWADPAPLPEGRIGSGGLRLDYRVMRKGETWPVFVRGVPWTATLVEFDADVAFAVLTIEGPGDWRRWQVVMSDTPCEWLSHWSFLRRAMGRVLLGGLGLGMAARWLARQPTVNEVVVIERDRALIEWVRPALPAKVAVVQGDFWQVVRELPRESFDTGWVDIWNSDEDGENGERRRACRLLRDVVRLPGYVGAWLGWVEPGVWVDMMAGRVPGPHAPAASPALAGAGSGAG